MLKSKESFLTALFILFSLPLGGCQFFSSSYETAASLDETGKYSQAIQAYLKYLEHHPGASLAPRVYYRIAKNYENQSDYDNALKYYQKVVADFPQTDEEIHSYLDLASLYRDKLKNNTKALEYNQLAVTHYLENIQIKDAVQSLIDAQVLTATALYTQKSYKTAAGTLDGIYKTYPIVFISPDTRARIDSLSDRAKRADAISKANVDSIILKSEIPFNKSFEPDFPAPSEESERVMASPDNGYLVSRKKVGNVYYLYVAQVPVKGDQAVFKLIKQTFGADKPTWSPDSQNLLYWRNSRGQRKLEKTNLKSMITQTLFVTKSSSLGVHPSYHPAGNKVAYIYEGRVCLINLGDSLYKQLLKTKQKLDYTADLSWSTDGTMIRCAQLDKHNKQKKSLDQLLVLDVSTANNP